MLSQTKTTSPAHTLGSARQGKTADDRVNYLLSDYDRVTKSLESAQRQLRLHKISHIAAFAIMALDSWFSFDVLMSAGGSQQMAIGLTILIAVTQWQVNTAIFNRRITGFLTPDRNRDGTITVGEWVRWGFMITIILSVYIINVGTNMIGVDGWGLGSLVFAVPGVPEWGWLAALTAFFFATLLCFGDELINVMADDNSASLKRRIPDLQNQQAVLDARVREAQSFRESVMGAAEEAGARRGANYRI